MKSIRVKFINFWDGFEQNSWFNHWKRTYTHPQINWELSTDENIDLLVSSVFGSINNINNYKCPKILYTRENLNHKHYDQYQSNLSLFDLVIGFNTKDNQIDIPWYYELFNLYELDCNKSYIPQNMHRKNLCLISRNPHKLRLSLIESFKKKNYTIDCPGLVGQNMNIKVKGGLGLDKINFMKNYYFNICPENSYATGYTTEKLFDCCVAGCIPIYYGCSNLNDGFYNKDRILHIKEDLSNYDNIIDEAIYLLNHKSELLSFMKQKPFTPYTDHHITTVKNKINTMLETLL